MFTKICSQQSFEKNIITLHFISGDISDCILEVAILSSHPVPLDFSSLSPALFWLTSAVAEAADEDEDLAWLPALLNVS